MIKLIKYDPLYHLVVTQFAYEVQLLHLRLPSHSRFFNL